MKTISIAVSEDDYEAFRRESQQSDRPIAQLIRESMAYYRKEHLEEKIRLTELPVVVGHRPLAGLPTRAELYEEVFDAEGTPR